MEAVYRTDRGKVRPHNEDYGGVFPKESGELLAVVADGMGGHLAGDVASKMATNELEKHWDQQQAIENAEDAENFFEATVKKINEKIFQQSIENKDWLGMGTTLVASVCAKNFATIVNVGDSRCYLYSDDSLIQVTEDHSLVNELVKSGQISKEEAIHHPRKNILMRAMGTEPEVEADIHTISFNPGNYILLCSDGLTNKVDESEITDVFLADMPLNQKANQLVRLANDKGGDDNITLAIIYHNGTDEKAGE